MQGEHEDKQVRLGDHPFLKSLTDRGLVYQGESPDTIITVVAAEGFGGDWAAYYQTPDSGSRVRELGGKLPEQVAAVIFPEWAKRLTYRR